MCWNVSCLIARQIEVEQLGVQFEDLKTSKKLKCVIIQFADDSNMITKEERAQMQMQKIIDKYNRLCGATGEHVEVKKLMHYSWQWRYSQGQKLAKDIKEIANANRRQLKETTMKENVKSLGP